MAASGTTQTGYRTVGEKDSPGGGFKRNFNLNPRGKLPLAPRFRPKMSRAKSRTTR